MKPRSLDLTAKSALWANRQVSTHFSHSFRFTTTSEPSLYFNSTLWVGLWVSGQPIVPIYSWFQYIFVTCEFGATGKACCHEDFVPISFFLILLKYGFIFLDAFLQKSHCWRIWKPLDDAWGEVLGQSEGRGRGSCFFHGLSKCSVVNRCWSEMSWGG